MKTVRSVERAARVLFFIAERGDAAGLSEISRALTLDKATTLRLLTTLERLDLVRQEPATKSYLLGPKVAVLANAPRSDLRQICRRFLEGLWAATRETVCLVCPRGHERIHVEVLPGRHELRFDPEIGSTWPIYVGASGKAMMAFLPPERIDQIISETGLARGNAAKVTAEPELRDELMRVRRQGFAISANETIEGGAAVASPLLNRLGEVVGVIAVRGPTVRLTAKVLRELAPDVLRTAEQISRALGWTGPLTAESGAPDRQHARQPGGVA